MAEQLQTNGRKELPAALTLRQLSYTLGRSKIIFKNKHKQRIYVVPY